MGEKESKWLEHLKAAEISDLKLSAYAAQHQIDVRRLYEAKRLRSQRTGSSWAVVRVRPDVAVEVAPKAREFNAPATVAMQARLVCMLGCWAVRCSAACDVWGGIACAASGRWSW